MAPCTFPNKELLPENILGPITTLTLPHHIANKTAIFEGIPWVYYLKILLKMIKYIHNEPSKKSSQILTQRSLFDTKLEINPNLLLQLLVGNPSPY